jgi:polar amino acid transport system substrate-binding protein
MKTAVHSRQRTSSGHLAAATAMLQALAITGVAGIAGPVAGAKPEEAKSFKASLAQMPVYAETKDKGVLVDLVKAIAEVSGASIEMQVVPFNRSIADVSAKAVHFHLPLIKSTIGDASKLAFDYSTETIFHVNFTLYTNKNKPLDPKKLKGFNIETDLAHLQYFDFPINPSTSIEASLKKVEAGRIDGFIFADAASDPIIKAQGLKNLKRELYQVFDVKIVLPKGEGGKEVDTFLFGVIKKLRASGKLQSIMGAVDKPFESWQP